MITVTFYKKVSVTNKGHGPLFREKWQKCTIDTGKDKIIDAYHVALEHGHNPDKRIAFSDTPCSVSMNASK